MLKRMIALYILVLVFMLSLGSTAYIVIEHSIEEYVMTSSLDMMAQLENTLQLRLAEVDGIANQLMLTPNVNRLQMASNLFEGENLSYLHDLMNNMVDYRIYNQFVIASFVVYPRSRMVVSAKYCGSVESFYHSFFLGNGESGPLNSESGNIKKRDQDKLKKLSNNWMDSIFGDTRMPKFLPPVSFYKGNRIYSAIPYMKWINNYGTPKGAVIIMIDNDEIMNMLSATCLSKNSWSYIVDAEGKVISTTDSDKPIIPQEELKGLEGVLKKTINGRNMFITYKTSSINGWKFVALNDGQAIFSSVDRLKRMFTIIIITVLIVAIIIEVAFSYKHTISIIRVFKIIKGNGYEDERSGDNVYEFLRAAVLKMIHDKQELTDKVVKQMPVFREMLTLKLVQGEYNDIDEVMALLEHIGYDRKGDYYSVLIISLNGYWEDITIEVMEKLREKKVIIREILEGLGFKLYCDIDKTDIALVLDFESNDQQQYRDKVERMYQAISDLLPEHSGIFLSIAAGEIYEGLLNIHQSFYEAKQVLSGMLWSQEKILIYENSEKNKYEHYYYTSELEMRLMNSVKSANQNKMEAILNEVFTANFIKKQISPNMVNLLLFELCGTLLKLAEQMMVDDKMMVDIHDLIDRMDTTNSVEFYSKIKELFNKLCIYAAENKKNHNIHLIEKIIGYIQENYDDNNISLISIAEQFNISDGYLSRLFREQKGCAISEYIEQIRMKHALELLLNSNIKVSEIAEKTGYTSLNSFSRAFRRYYGISPTTMREIRMQNPKADFVS